jgi:multiple sugar transport system substrate-binding protein
MLHATKTTRRSFATLILAILAACPGCFEQKKLAPDVAPPAAPVTLRLVVFGDPELAQAIDKLRGEWHARQGSKFEVIQAADDQLGEMSKYTPDAILFRSARLGELVESDWISPLPKELLASEELDWADIYSVIQAGEASYAGRAYAVPFGSPALTLCYRRDLFEKFERKPPQTWPEYQQTVEFFQDRARLGDLAPPTEAAWHASVEPLAAGWAGHALLARAAAYARHRDNFSTLFNIDDFQPLIDGPPFVRALEELVAAAKSTRGDADSPAAARLDPARARGALLAGECAMAITWPTAAGDRKTATGQLANIGFAELPGSRQSFNFATHVWDARTADEPIHVPLDPIAGRLGAVVKDNPNTDAAFRLLGWLSGPKWGTQVAASSTATSLYRDSQAAAAQQWVEAGMPAAIAKQYAAVAGRSLSRPVWVHALRIPGWIDYQAALDMAVAQALDGQSPAESLHAAAQKWREISDRLGVDGQLLAYRRSLGID